nr:glycosyl transferase family 2 [Proteiniphilum sp.]
TRDLEEFRAKGMGSVFLVNSAGGLGGVQMPQGVRFLSPEWKELYRYALQEASRLNLKVGVNLCSGWCMGGPWIKPENAGRWYLQSSLAIEGAQKFSGKLPLPGNRVGYDHVFNPPGFKDYIDLPLDELDYRDTSIVAFPVEPGKSPMMSEELLKQLPAKANRKDASNFIKARDLMDPTLIDWSDNEGANAVPLSRVIDLTDKVADGRLEWDVPVGNWIIVRTGHRMTGSRLMIANPEADGLSVGWLDSSGVELQFEHLGKVLIEEAGAFAGRTLTYFADDSFEDGFPNWTDQIVPFFLKYRGYDPTPYLPILTGFVIGSLEISDRFLYDYRKTVADCMADNHYKRFAQLCHENGLRVQNESAGPSRSGTMCMDGLKNLGRSDYPTGEFWLGIRHDEEGGLDEKLGYGATRLEGGQNKVTKMVASASHTYGKKFASAESFTTYRHWQDSPETLKPATDRAFCEGINRILIHTSTATRPEDGKPGYEYGAGTHFNPNVTWWDFSSGFLSYIGRCQHLLQSGMFVADLLYYNGDWAPNIVEPKHVDPSLGEGYDYDVCNEEVLLTRLSVKDKKLVLPDGMSYHVLVLPDTDKMPVEVIRKIRELVRSGATIVGPPPTRDPGLKNFPHDDKEVQSVAAEVWGDCDGRVKTFQRYGNGRVFHGVPLRQILKDDNIVPDFTYSGDEKSNIDFIHRTFTDGTELYFVVNRNKRRDVTECTFRVTGRQPELWDPLSGKIRPVHRWNESEGRTSLNIEFFPHQSFFVLFPGSGKRDRVSSVGKVDFPASTELQQITGAWKVKFDPRWGGPAEIAFGELSDWSQSSEDGIRYYSGKAVYLKKINFTHPINPGCRLFLDLGIVKNIAAVKLNGTSLGVVWTAPWRVDITDAISRGENMLEIEVINLWPNRLIGDASLSPEERLTHTNIVFKSDMTLLPSGLLGPVVICQVNQEG